MAGKRQNLVAELNGFQSRFIIAPRFNSVWSVQNDRKAARRRTIFVYLYSIETAAQTNANRHTNARSGKKPYEIIITQIRGGDFYR